MSPSTIYIAIAVLAFIGIVISPFAFPQKGKKLSPLAGLAFGFILAGMIFGEKERLIGYGLIGVGILLSMADIVVKRRQAV